MSELARLATTPGSRMAYNVGIPIRNYGANRDAHVHDHVVEVCSVILIVSRTFDV